MSLGARVVRNLDDIKDGDIFIFPVGSVGVGEACKAIRETSGRRIVGLIAADIQHLSLLELVEVLRKLAPEDLDQVLVGVRPQTNSEVRSSLSSNWQKP